MTGRCLIPFCCLLMACASAEQLCFEKATQDYAATQQLIVEAQQALERGYVVAPDNLQFIDVSECGPTLEARAICTTQSQASADTLAAIDRQKEQYKLAQLEARLPELRKKARREYEVCLASGREVSRGLATSARHQW